MSESVRAAPLCVSHVAPTGPPFPDGPPSHGRNLAHPHAGHGLAAATALLTRLFRTFEGHLAMRLWNGHPLRLGRTPSVDGPPPFTLVMRNPGAISAMVLGFDRLRFAEAYFRGDVDIEGDFFAALGLKDHLDSIRLSWRDRLAVLLPALRLQALKKAWPKAAGSLSPSQNLAVTAHSRQENHAAIHFHYDVSNAFYALWLDPAMVYSCAYFETPDTVLAAAQHAKLDHICRKLLLRPGDKFLDIGCGWGALLIHAAKHYGVEAHGVTLSRQQLGLARERIAAAGLASRVSVELRDYRDLLGENLYDKVASVGMFEHVGLKNLPLYFATVRRLLKPQGLFLNHGITHDVEGWNNTLSTEFINRYIFPDGQLDTVSNILRGMEQGGFEIADVESLRPHYALTLRRWVARLERHHDQALEHVDESTYRCWRLYMAACALEFESGEIGVYQLLASKRTTGTAALPLTRRHLPRHPSFRRTDIMTAKGTHERIQAENISRVFAVSALRLDAIDHVVEVLWAEVSQKSNLGVGAPVRASASEVITALHAGQRVLAVFPTTHGHRPDRAFVVLEHKDGSETLVLEGSSAIDRELGDLSALQAR